MDEQSILTSSQGAPSYTGQPPPPQAGYGTQPGAAPGGYPQPTGGPGYPAQAPGYPAQAPGYPQQSGPAQGYPPQGASPGYPPQGAGPGYQQPSGAPGYQQPSEAPGYQQPSGAPGYQQPSGAPGYPPQGGAPGYPPQGSGPGYPQPSGAPGYPPPSGAGPGYPPPAGGAPTAGTPLPPTYKGDMPPEDIRDDPNMGAPQPSAPPLDLMDRLPGYDAIGFNEASLPPPPSYDESQRQPPHRENIGSGPSINDQDARDALLQHVSDHCCYGAKPARDMKFNDLRASSAFHYTLETFGEGRSTKWAHSPYTGQAVVVVGAPPSPWDIQATPPQMFKTSKLDIEVPNTASVKPCHGCGARGFERCYRCHGRGRLFCTSCNGSGRGAFSAAEGDHHHHNRHGNHHNKHHHNNHHHNNHSTSPCNWCHGSGRKCCYTCGGSGQNMCGVCRGRANLRWFIKLTVKWTNHKEDHVVERTALPDHLIKGVSGQMAFQESQPRVWPINHFPDGEINAASNQLVSSHGSKFTSERLLMQRHQVRIVPVTQVFYKYKNKDSFFFVYGFEHKVHAPDYPAQCCCGCTVL